MTAKKLKIMIVEDSELIKDRLIYMLKGLDNVGDILYAGTFAESLALIEKEIPDVLFLDIGLPDKSGIYLLYPIKENNWNIQVIVFTNEANEYYKRLCIRLGANEFLDKTKDFDKITDIISNISKEETKSGL